ncbi:MAG TPA: hypothetical protein VGM33_18950 [Baekduia sp.]
MPDAQARSTFLAATLANVAVDQTTLEGKSVLRLRNSDFPDGYEETILLDAGTGVMLQMIGGTAGQAPDVVVTYDIKRVTAAEVLRGRDRRRSRALDRSLKRGRAFG